MNECCWNEEKEEWFDSESIGIGQFRCTCCGKKYKEGEKEK